jgi:transcription elongation factor Elf1
MEKALADKLKQKIGIRMEEYVVNNIHCPECGCKSLYKLGTNLPSLDMVCNCCGKYYEVKSKCLSVNNLPNDIVLPHGLYNDYYDRIKDGLGLIIIIYGANRNDKTITIREILYANNKNLQNNNLIYISKRANNLSTINIKNKNNLRKLDIEKEFSNITIKNDFERLKQNFPQNIQLAECKYYNLPTHHKTLQISNLRVK